ncbi:hypothetical protein [Ulvibacter litoralis]|uniref:Uncharacterized protein n=1 Tax=Ulvibacter litoralis TaxID=227084 RepID=A0A1G7JYI1_9FLAO|nr:hypothetical protein [Ulvibacter litoralis]GHC65198.1 hypothetical protein GCM10008083_33070 [Ulvibacter litoralis]SDF29912.1 hypothetical protein SAMN05421855_1371 [Ulvibacter litoralis]
MRIYRLLICIILVSCSDKNNSASDNASDLQVDTLTFTSRGFNSGHKLKLTSDNQFIDENYWASCFGGGGKQIVSGTYISENKKSILTPKTVEYIESPMLEGDTILKKRIFNYNPDSLKIKTDYYLVEWRRNKYLLSENTYPIIEDENDFIRFAQYFNSESRRFKFDGFLYIDNEHTCDSLNPNFDYKQIPKKWRKYFLDKPISIEINKLLKVERIKDEYADGFYCQVELNKGEKDSVFNGLYFKNKTSRLTLFIDSTSQNNSYVTVYMSKDKNPKSLIGIELRTRWE